MARAGSSVYLPPHYAATTRYPVLYLLHGNEQLAVEFLLQGDLQGELITSSKPDRPRR